MTKLHGPRAARRPPPATLRRGPGIGRPLARSLRVGSIAAVLVSLASPPAARAAGPSDWVGAARSAARLIDGGRAPGGIGLLAGVEIKLDPHFITYWRDPGDAGVPPSFSFAGSTNLKAATLRYPAPRSLDEAGFTAFGYDGGVTFPIQVEAVDPAQPVGLAVGLDYAACHEICLPAHADLRLTLDGGPSAEAGLVGDALAAVPRPAAVGDADVTPAILAVAPDGAGGFAVSAALDAGAGTLFVEAPEGWAFAAGAGAVPDAAGRTLFPVKRLDHPEGVDRPPAPVVLTLVAPAGAIEVPVQLDAGAAKP